MDPRLAALREVRSRNIQQLFLGRPIGVDENAFERKL